MYETDDDKPILLSPGVDPADIEQEYQILLWQGKKPSRKLLYLKAKRYEASLFDFTTDLSYAQAIDWAETPVPSAEAFEQITTWALSQSETIQAMVFSFLEDPTDTGLHQILKTTGLKPAEKLPAEQSLTDKILEFCQDNRSIAEIYELGRNLLTSKRPEAAVRQALRRLIKSGKIEESDNVYRVS